MNGVICDSFINLSFDICVVGLLSVASAALFYIVKGSSKPFFTTAIKKFVWLVLIVIFSMHKLSV